jgi:hypothetical protein
MRIPVPPYTPKAARKGGLLLFFYSVLFASIARLPLLYRHTVFVQPYYVSVRLYVFSQFGGRKDVMKSFIEQSVV